MSKRNGDKAHFGIARKKKMLRRKRTEELRQAIAAEQKNISEPQPDAK